MKRLLIFIFAIVLLSSCHRLKEKGKETINATGKVVGSGASEFFGGVKDGIDKTFQSTMIVSDALHAKGVSTGKFSINQQSEDSAFHISVYFTFEKDFDGEVTVKVFDPKGVEYGRSRLNIAGKKGEAKYADILFDKRTAIESKSKFIIE